jgi:hypothetical protein
MMGPGETVLRCRIVPADGVVPMRGTLCPGYVQTGYLALTLLSHRWKRHCSMASFASRSSARPPSRMHRMSLAAASARLDAT